MASFFRSGKKCVAIGRNYMNHVKGNLHDIGLALSREAGFWTLPPVLDNLVTDIMPDIRIPQQNWATQLLKSLSSS